MRPLLIKTRLATQLIFVRFLRFWGVLKARIYYIGSSEVLPPPLSSDEEASLLERLSSGDLSVKTVLIERNLRLVVYIARKFENTGVPIESGLLGLSV